jgi:hypothetical protein
MKNKFYSFQIGIKWVQINGLSIKYTNHLERASFWDSKKKALSWKKAISEKYPLAELVELKLTPIES